mgnify:CR=1 FL=1
MRQLKISSKENGDKSLILLILILCFFGLIMIFNASSVAALRDFNDKFHYLKNQGTWFVLGLASFIFFSFLDYRFLKKIALPFFLFCLFLLILVLIPGVGREVYGGRRWLEFGFLSFQPAELAKLSLIIYLSALFEKKRDFKLFITLLGLVLLLLLLEPDLGTAVITIASAFAVYFISGASFKQIAIFLGSGFLAAPFLILLSPYRKQRLMTFLNSSFDAQGASYHVRQILIALGSGGLLGRGIGQSRQKFLFLPEVTTDSIFAIIAEEFGFWGASLLIIAFIFLLYRGIKIANSADSFGRSVAVGIVAFIGFQALINLGAMVALIPLTGVPLPFISYGGSSLLVNLSAMGILYNISKH